MIPPLQSDPHDKSGVRTGHAQTLEPDFTLWLLKGHSVKNWHLIIAYSPLDHPLSSLQYGISLLFDQTLLPY